MDWPPRGVRDNLDVVKTSPSDIARDSDLSHDPERFFYQRYCENPQYLGANGILPAQTHPEKIAFDRG